MNEIYSRAADEVSIQHTKYKQLHKQRKEQWYLSVEWSSTDNHLVQHNKQYQMKVLLNSFHLYGHTLGFHPQN